MRYLLKKTVAMVGMMGAGKTAVGQAMAGLLGVPFRDSDTEIVTASNMEIAEIFARYGEEFFREKEAQVLARLLDGAPAVLSTGGGAYLLEKNRTLISERGVALWLKADLDVLWSRVRHKSSRPLLNTADPEARLAELYAARVPLYAMADLAVETRREYSIAETAARAVAALATRPDVLEKAR